MTFQFRPAQRTEAKPLIGLYAESGAGKTYSALLLARGFVGPTSRIGMIETESGRGEAYADIGEYPEIGGYHVLSMRGEFSPESFGKAITAAEAAQLDALIIDSASHEWEAVGGVLDQASRNQAAGMKGVIVWQKPKIDHQKHFMLRLLATSIPLVIVCLRAKYPMVQAKKSDGSKEWVRAETLEPKQSEDILFELFAHGWIDRQHRFHTTKLTSKSLEQVFENDKPITLHTGQRLANWASQGLANGEKHRDWTVFHNQFTARLEQKKSVEEIDQLVATNSKLIAAYHDAKPEYYENLMSQIAERKTHILNGGQNASTARQTEQSDGG